VFVHINPHSGIPVYLQIAEEIKHLVAIGGLRPGDLLPSCRRLSAELHINPNTVQEAYRFLEREGLVETPRGRQAVVVAGGDDDRGEALKMELATQQIRETLIKVLQLGFPMDRVEEICRTQLDELRRAKGEAREAVEAR